MSYCEWSVGGMIEIGENLIAWRKSSACVNLPTTCAGLRLYLDPHCGSLVTNDPNHGMAVAAVDIDTNIQHRLCNVCDRSAVKNRKLLRYVKLCVVLCIVCV
jgi:hypothetical protein